jgi:hypothetical protein
MDLSAHIGKELTEQLELHLKLQIDNGSIRIKRPGYLYTQELKMGRTNIHVNEDNIITKISQG